MQERHPGWSAVGLGVMGGAITGAALLWPLSQHSTWETCVSILFSLLIVVGLYWAVAALAGYWPFRAQAVQTNDLPSGAKVAEVHLREAGIRQKKVNALMDLLTEGQAVLGALERAASRAEFAGNAAFLAVQWVTKADDTMRQDFGSPDDFLMRSEPTRPPFQGLSQGDGRAWVEVDRRVRWLRDRTKETQRDL